MLRPSRPARSSATRPSFACLASLSTLLVLVMLGAVDMACGPAGAATSSSGAGATNARPSAAPPANIQHVEPDDDVIAKAGEDYVALYASIHPEDATALGLHEYDDQLDDRSAAGHARDIEREVAFLSTLEQRFADPKASPAARTDLAMLLGALRCDIRKDRELRPLQRKPDVYLEPLNAIFHMTARSYAPVSTRARNVVVRLEKIPKVVDDAKHNLLNPPRIWTEIAMERASSARAFLEQQRPFLVEAMPDETARVDAALKTAIGAYEGYRTYLQKEVLPRSTGHFAAGRELFDYLLENDYFLDERADELLDIGKKVFAETSSLMTEVAKRIDPKAKGWPEVTAKLKAKHPAAGELLAAYEKEVKRARAYLVEKDAIAFPDGDDLEVVETPTFMRATITAAYDQPPPFDAQTTKGFFFVTPIDTSLPKKRQEEMLRENDWADIVDTSVHEAYPGHHLQLSFARRSPSMIRRALDRAIFSEGWALYGEELMAELGYYDDAQRLIQLEWALVRAARIILDVGLHVGDMTFEQAVEILTDEVHLERSLAISEVKRYTESPTQPSAYMIGRQKILELRERARKRDGVTFSLKAFHADLLTRGTVPPSLLAREMFVGAR